jgi:hypothetical protein
MTAEWSPSMPRRLSARHLRQYQRGRDSASAEFAAMTSLTAVAIDLR